MKKICILCMLAATSMAASAQQLPNTTFDANWVNCYPWEAGNYVSTARGTQPEGWCISNVSQSALPIVGEEVTPGANGSGKAVKLSNVSASIGSNTAPGYITLGTAWATAETKMTSVRNPDGGVFGGISFSYHPDAVRFTYKCDRSAGTENMSVIAYLWKGTWTQKDVPSNTAVGVFSWGSASKVDMTDRIHNILGKDCLTGGEITKTEDAALVASVEYYSSEALNDWLTKEIPLNYGEYAGKPVDVEKLNIVIASNGLFDDRSGIKAGNSVTVDDVELVYYHALSSLSFEGVDVAFSEETTEYTVAADYDETKLSYTVKGQAATATTSFDEETKVLTIRVEGEDIALNPNSFTEYKLTFEGGGGNGGGGDDPVQVETKVYPLDLYVTISGVTSDKQVAQIVVERLESGNINFVLKNFVLNPNDTEPMPIGNIVIKDLEVAADGSFAFKGGLQLEAGDDPAYNIWYGPMVTSMAGGSVPVDLKGRFIDENTLTVYIFIDMEDTAAGYKVIVHLGYARATMAIDADTQHSTFCSPFAVSIPANVHAYTIDSATPGGLLLLSEVSFFIPANTPVVVTAEGGLDMMEFYGRAEEGTPVCGMLTGVYEETQAPADAYVLQNNGGRLGFYPVSGGQPSTVAANRCYLTSESSASSFFFEGEDIAGHVPFSMTQELYNTLMVSTSGSQGWDDNSGIRLGKNSEIFSWGTKYYVIEFSGIPDKLSFRYQSSQGASGRDYRIYESADGENFTEIWRDNRGGGVDGSSYQSPDIQLSPDTRYIKFFYSGNCAAYYRDVKVTELHKFEADIENEAKEIYLNENANSASFTFTHANASVGNITVTGPDSDCITVEAPEMVGGYDVYGQHTITVSYDFETFQAVEDDIIITNGEQTERVHLVARIENPDAIQGVKESKGKDAIYNVSGQRIGKLQKGINIVNGRKVLK